MRVLVTGANGFIGKNLVVKLKEQPEVEVVAYDLNGSESVLHEGLLTAELIFHLAGINRPEKPEDFETGNFGFTKEVCDQLEALNRKPAIIFASSVQAELDNPYGSSKRRAEEKLLDLSRRTGAPVVIFRMKNVFGKWCRPNYNSAVATFCHNIARDFPIFVSDPANEVKLVYIDDVCDAMMEAAGLLSGTYKHLVLSSSSVYAEITPTFTVTLGTLVDTIRSFKATRSSLKVPKFDDPFVSRLYATYLSYLETSEFDYGLDSKSDNRGSLAELLKSAAFGQIFVSRTRPGITRGNHYHHTKTEKFIVLEGQAIIRFRDTKPEAGGQSSKVFEYRVSGDEYRVVDIPPGYTHSIENVGEGELVTLFWANEIFNPEQTDTYYDEVLRALPEEKK